MIIKYSKKRLRSNLRLGVFFIAIGIILVLLSHVTDDWGELSIQSVGVGQIGAGMLILFIYLFEKSKQYLTLKNGELIKNSLFPKRIKLNEINSISEFAGDLKISTEKSDFVIDTQIIHPDSLIDLKDELKNYNLK